MRPAVLSLLALCACDGVTVDDVLDLFDTDDTDASDTDDTDEDEPEPEPLPVLPCHAWDPMEVTAGTRTYAVDVGGTASVETHTLGVVLDPPPAAGTFASRVVSTATPASDVTVLTGCSPDGTAAAGGFDLGFDGVVLGIDMDGVPATPPRYLPHADDVDAAYEGATLDTTPWSATSVYDLRLRGIDTFGLCPDPLPLNRTTTATYTAIGFEPVQVDALGTEPVLALRVDLDQTERVDIDPADGLSRLCRNALIGEDVVGDVTVTTTRVHRWYVRGVGLVAAMTVDPADVACVDPVGAVVPAGCVPSVNRRLSACESLFGCP